MVPNPQTTLYHLKVKRPFWRIGSKALLPGDRTAIRPDRQDNSKDRWLIVRVPIGGDHMGLETSREHALSWEESLFSWLDAHPTAMWDGHEIGGGEFKLYLLTPTPPNLLLELADRSVSIPLGACTYERVGPEGDEIPIA